MVTPRTASVLPAFFRTGLIRDLQLLPRRQKKLQDGAHSLTHQASQYILSISVPMCVSLVLYDSHPALLLLLAFNRDEFWDRQALQRLGAACTTSNHHTCQQQGTHPHACPYLSSCAGPRSQHTSGRMSPACWQGGMRSGRAPGWASPSTAASRCSQTTERCDALTGADTQ